MRGMMIAAMMTFAAFAGPAGAQTASTGQAPVARSSFYATKIQVGDMAANLRFYIDFLGMQKVPNDTPGHDNVVILKMNDGTPPNPAQGPMLILNGGQSAPQTGNAYGPLVFIIPDVDAMISKMKAAGTKVLEEPKHAGSFAVAYVADPDGRPVELLQIAQR